MGRGGASRYSHLSLAGVCRRFYRTRHTPLWGKTARWSWQWFHDSQSAGRMRATRRGWWRLSVLCHPRLIVRCMSHRKGFGRLVPARLYASPRLHLRPIYVVVSDGPIGDLILGGFVLRCFQHLSCPTRIPIGAAGHNRFTGGPSNTVLVRT